METLKINFGYFWPGFMPEDNYFTRVLSKKYKLEISDNPDLYFFTYPYNGKREYLNFKCHRVYLGWENERANWNCCDYVLDSDFYSNNPRHMRWPIWAAWQTDRLVEPKEPKIFLDKKKFACMVVSNSQAKERIDFFHQLSKYKQVDSGGKFLNNVGGPVANKIDFISDYKFVISFENSNYPGYSTEKLIEPMLVNSIPIYWGNRLVGRDFNTNSFIHVNKFASYDEVIEKIIELDQNEDKYLQLATQPWYNNNQMPEDLNNESLERFFDFVLNDMKTRKPVGATVVKANLHKAQLLKARIQKSINDRLGIETKGRVNVSEKKQTRSRQK